MGAAPKDTLGAIDEINGGTGRDTLVVEGDQALAGTITNVETFQFVGSAAVNNDTAIDASAYTGLDTVALKNVVDTTGVVINALATGSTVALSGSTVVTGGVSANFAAAATAANVTATGLTAANAVNVAGAALTTVNFSGDTGLVTGAGQVSIDDIGTTDTVTTVNINATGASNLVVAGDKVATIDASASSAGVKLTVGAVAADLAIKGGNGDDTVTLDLATLSAKDSIDLGAGNDNAVFTITSTSGATLGTNATVAATVVSITTAGYDLLNKVGAEQITLKATVGADSLSVDASKLNVSKIGLETSGVVSKLLNADTVVSDVTGTTLTLQAARDTSDVTKFATDAGTVNVVSQDKAETVAISANTQIATGSDFSKLVLTGKGDVSFDNATGKAATVDASALTGALTFAAGAQVEKLTLGAGKDALTVAVGNSTYAATDSITNFVKGDTISLTGLTAATSLVKFDAATAGSVSFEQALTQAAAFTGVQDGTKAAWFTWTDGNTYIVQDNDAKAVIDQTSTDTVIKLAGVVTLAADAAGLISVA